MQLGAQATVGFAGSNPFTSTKDVVWADFKDEPPAIEMTVVIEETYLSLK